MDIIQKIEKVKNDPNLNTLSNNLYQFMLKVEKGESRTLTLICSEVEIFEEYVQSVYDCITTVLHLLPHDEAQTYNVQIKVQDKNIVYVKFSREGSKKENEETTENKNDF
jgi:5,10-methylenetetrahydrofolate reductase